MIGVVYGVREYRGKSAATIATDLETPVRLRSLSLLALFQAAAAGGADAAELGGLWQFDGYVKRVESALQGGDLAGMQALLATLPVTLTAGTRAALDAVIANNTLTAGAATWDAEDGDVPTFDAAWVTATLTEAGYGWDGSAWVR